MKNLLLIQFCFFVFLNAHAQGDNITGYVYDADGEPLIGATVLVNGTTTNGVITEVDGSFSLKASPSDTLVIQYIGFEPQEVVVRNQTTFEIVLNQSTEALNEIVVVGYGEVRKKDLTGAVTSMKPEDLNVGAVSNASQMLQGRIPGLYVNSQDQQPGASPEIILRGRGSITDGIGDPLIVIDGFPMGTVDGTSAGRSSTDILNTINPNDIAQIDILKDASATAIYGSRGSNGVIIITTKKAGNGTDGVLVEYNNRFSTQQAAKKFDVLNRDEYVRFYIGLSNDPNFQLTPQPGFNNNFFPHPIDQLNSLPNTDWQSEILNTGNFNQEHNVALSGTASGIQYRVSAGILDSEGFLDPREYDRYNFNAKLNTELNRFSLGLNIGYIFEKRNELQNDYLAAARFAPTAPVFNEDGSLSSHPVINTHHPFFPEFGNENFSDINTIRISGNIGYDVLEGFRLEARGALQQRSNETFNQQKIPDAFDQEGFNSASLAQESNYNVNIDLLSRYNKSIGKHQLNGLLGTNYQTFRDRGSSIYGQNFPLQNVAYYDIAAGSNLNPQSFWREKTIVSLFGRVNYDFDSKYFLTFNFRRDGATSFGENEKFGSFPSVALAWRLDNESFLSNSNWNTVKLKASYGSSGNANVPLGNTTTLLSFWPTYVGGDVTRGVIWAGTETGEGDDNSTQPNPNLKWEVTNTLNLGAELGNEFFSAEINYYRRTTQDAFLERQVPLETGFSNIVLNAGELLNEGMEVRTDFFVNLIEDILTWNPSIWFSYNENTVVDIAGDSIIDESIWINNIYFGDAVARQTPNALNAIWGYEFDGIWQQNQADLAESFGAEPGDPRFVDINGDGQITTEDQKLLGSADPGILIGFQNRFVFKNWELSISADGVFDKTVVNSTKVLFTIPNLGYYHNLSTDVLDRWTPDNPSNEIPSLVKNVASELPKSTWAIQDAWFIRMREITLTYRFNTRSNFLNQLNVFASASNLFTITNYDGINPDQAGAIDSPFAASPFMRTYTIGLNASF